MNKESAVDEDDAQKLKDELHEFFDKIKEKKGKPKAAVAPKNKQVHSDAANKGKDSARKRSEQLKAQGGEKGGQGEIDLGAVIDPDSQSEASTAMQTVKKALNKLQPKVVELDGIINNIGKKPDVMGLSVRREAQELRVKGRAHVRMLARLALVPPNKVNVAEMKNAATTAQELILQVARVKVCAKPHSGSSVCGDDMASVAGSSTGKKASKASSGSHASKLKGIK